MPILFFGKPKKAFYKKIDANTHLPLFPQKTPRLTCAVQSISVRDSINLNFMGLKNFYNICSIFCGGRYLKF